MVNNLLHLRTVQNENAGAEAQKAFQIQSRFLEALGKRISKKDRNGFLRQQKALLMDTFAHRFEFESLMFQKLCDIFDEDCPHQLLDLMSGWGNVVMALLKEFPEIERVLCFDNAVKKTRARAAKAIGVHRRMRPLVGILPQDDEKIPNTEQVTLLSTGLVFPLRDRMLRINPGNRYGHLDQHHGCTFENVIQSLELRPRLLHILDGSPSADVVESFSVYQNTPNVLMDAIKAVRDILEDRQGWTLEKAQIDEDKLLYMKLRYENENL